MERLTRSKEDQIIAGVAGGFAEYFQVDPVLVRLIFVILTLGGGSGVLVYIILWLVMPESGSESKSTQEAVEENKADIKNKAENVSKDLKKVAKSKNSEMWIGVGIMLFGFVLLMGTLGIPQALNPFWYIGLAMKYMWPLLLVAVGLIVITKSNGK